MILLSLTILGCLVPAWFTAGKAFQAAHLPGVSGYLVAGALSGPHATAILRPHHLADVAFVEHICLSYIALLAGAELHVSGTRHIRRQVIAAVIAISFLSWLLVAGSAAIAAPRVPFLAALPLPELVAVCNLLGVLAMARSPAAAIAVMKEIQGKGPFCALAMAIVVAKDVVVFLAFSLALKAAEQVTSAAALGGLNPVAAVVDPLAGVAAALAVGAVGGVLLDRTQRWSARSLLHYPYIQAVVPIVASTSVYFLNERLKAEPLLACVALGAVATNARPGSQHQGANEDAAAKFHASPAPGATRAAASDDRAPPLAALLGPVSAVLFGLVGSGLHVDKVFKNAGLAALLFAARVAGIWAGAAAGGAVGGVPQPHRSRLWQAMITQAGIAMGLTRVAVARCAAPWGPDFEALMAGVVAANLMVGPPLFRRAITAAGEANREDLPAGAVVGPGAVPTAPAALHHQEAGFLTPAKADLRTSQISMIPVIDLSPTPKLVL